jgi:two-component system sensor histidine kinase CpxA
MRSLFVKIFLSFLLTIIIVTSAGIFLTYLRDQEFPPLAHQSFAKHAIAEYGHRAIEAFETRGIVEVDAFSEKLMGDTGIRIILFDDTGRPLTHQHVPRRMQHMTQRALRSGEVVFPMAGLRNWLASPIQNRTGKNYFVALGLPDQPPMEHLFKGMTHGFLGWRLLVLLLVTSATCFWLARSLTSPIRRLRQVTRQFATGDLSTRIGSQITGKNEIAGLAKDFDEMAGKIEVLVSGQKRLLRDISHELRSPLARLGVALELARQNGSEESQRKAFSRIELEADRMNEMIGQLLSLTRLENSTNEIPQTSFDLCLMLSRLVQDADYEANNVNKQVSFTGPAKLFFKGYEGLLARALENVIRNGIRYTPEGTLVKVELRSEVNRIWIGISDQGPGVPEESLSKLFEPFYRVADARDRVSGGTGIGLAIAEQAIRLHGGNISALNKSTGGLLIEISLPKNNGT